MLGAHCILCFNIAPSPLDSSVQVVRVAPNHDNIILTCGRNNIRVWRLKDSLDAHPLIFYSYYFFLLWQKSSSLTLSSVPCFVVLFTTSVWCVARHGRQTAVVTD